MGLFSHSIRTKGLRNFFIRFFTIASRFGITEKKYARYLSCFQDLQREFSFRTSFPITAFLVRRHTEALKPFRDSFLFLIHGLYHVDYSDLAPETVKAHVREARSAMASLSRTEQTGFRAPYLRYSDRVRDALASEKISFDSSRNIFVADAGLSVGEKGWGIIRQLYSPLSYDDTLSLPYTDGGMTEIPVTLPDDEIVIDRMGIRSAPEIFDVYRRMAAVIFENEEMFVMQLHPERILFFSSALQSLFREVLLKKNVWVTDLQSLAQWHGQRAKRTYAVDPDRQEITCAPLEPDDVTGYGVEFRVEGGAIRYRSSAIPAVFVRAGTDERVCRQLEQDGFFLVRDDRLAARCSRAVDMPVFSAPQYRTFCREITGGGPLLRLNRWPGGKKGAFCLSGDIDALTIGDFFSRIRHFSGAQ